jgi:hypothetical protein
MQLTFSFALHYRSSFCCAAALLLTVGCGKSSLRYAPVDGVVTVDGKPIGRAEVVLTCDEVQVRPRPTTRALTDESGHFILRSLTPEKSLIPGAVVGKHHVIVTTRILELDNRGNTRVVREEMLGHEYTNGETLTVDVPSGGIKDLKFDLKSDKRKLTVTASSRR